MRFPIEGADVSGSVTLLLGAVWPGLLGQRRGTARLGPVRQGQARLVTAVVRSSTVLAGHGLVRRWMGAGRYGVPRPGKARFGRLRSGGTKARPGKVRSGKVGLGTAVARLGRAR